MLQGIRRVIAVTASEAEEAVSKAEGLTKAMDAAEKLSGPQLDAEIVGLRQVRASALRLLPSASHLGCVSSQLWHGMYLCWDTISSAAYDKVGVGNAVLLQSIDKSALPAAAKAALRNRLAGLQKRVLDDQKAAAAANKAQATSAAVDAADSAAAAGRKHIVLELKVCMLP